MKNGYGFRIKISALVLLLCCGMLYAVPVIAPDPVVIWESPDPEKICPRSPGICRLESGRLIFTMEYSQGGCRYVPGIRQTPDGKYYRGLAFISDDGGKNFRQTGNWPLWMARPFTAGGKLYVLGQYDDIGVVVSEDNGETWSEVSWLTEGQFWHQSACNVLYARNRVYLVMERTTDHNKISWPVATHAPVVLSASVDADLTKREAWTFSNEITFSEMVDEIGGIKGIGVPFYFPGPTVKGKQGIRSRPMAPPGWLETNIVAFTDPDNLWYDPENRTFYLWMRAHTGTTNLAAIARAVEDEEGNITVEPARAPSHKPILYVPCPGGHLRFHILHDEETGLFWMASNQSTDSMIRPDRLPRSRYYLPDNERHRLALHFSKNCIDWCFAGLIDKTDDPRQSRSYPVMAFDGDDLVVVARSGDEKAKNAHDGNIVTLHRIPDFRKLVY